MDRAAFTESAPGRLVPTIDGASAFVPDPIPRNISLDNSTVRILADAENSLGRLVGTTGRLVNPYLVGSPLLRREAIASSRIEGTVTTPEQLVLLEVTGNPQDTRNRDTQEVLNYIRAMQHAMDRLRELPVCLRLLREVHNELVKGVRGERERPGEFRNIQNWIGNPGQPITEARYVPPPVPEMTEALHDLELFLHRTPGEDDPPLLIELALVHYQFEAIHPFRDGNGRIGRLILPLLLCSRGRMRDPLLYLSSFFEKNREVYIDLLFRVSQRGDWRAWIQFFLRGVMESANEAVEQVEELIALREQYHKKFQAARSSALMLRLIDHIFQSPAITIGGTAKLLGVSQVSASSYIGKLVGAGILAEATRRKKNKIYLASEVLAFLEDHPRVEPPSPSAQTVTPAAATASTRN